MTRDNVQRLALIGLLSWLFLLGVANAQVNLDVLPKVAFENPYKDVTFRLLIRITEDEGNRKMSYSGDCGANVITRLQNAEYKVYTIFLNMRVVSNCVFSACVHKIVDGKMKNLCVTKVVETQGRPP